MDHLDELRELFSWYVPEVDYELGGVKDDDDKWHHVYVNVGILVAAIFGVTLFGAFCKLKHRWLVNAKCAFCNCVVRVWRGRLHWWLCNCCQRINGYPKDSFVQTDSSSVDEIQETKPNVTFTFPNARNDNKNSSGNLRDRLSHSKSDLNVSTAFWQSMRVLQDKGNDSTLIGDESSPEIETNLQKIRNKIKQLLGIDRGVEKLPTNAVDKKCCTASSTPGNSTTAAVCLPGEMSNLRKMHMQLIADDLNRRYELLSAEKALCAKMRQMRQLEKSLRDAKRDAARDENRSCPIRKRNTFFERSFSHSIAAQNSKEVELNKDAATARMAALKAYLSELRDMHTNEIAQLKSQIKSKSSILKKIEHLKFGVVEFYNNVQHDQFNSLMGRLSSTDAHEFTFEVQNQTGHNNSESGYLSESEVAARRNDRAMSVIVEENDDDTASPRHIQVLKRTFDRLNQDNNNNKPASAEPRIPRARIVKPVRGGQRPAKVVPTADDQ